MNNCRNTKKKSLTSRDKNITCRKLSSKYESYRQLPQNLKEEDKDIFAHELKRNINGVDLLCIENITVAGDGTVTISKGRRLPEAFLYYNKIYAEPFLRYRAQLLKYRLRKKYFAINEPVVFVADYWSHGYFHWLTETLPRLVVARNEILEQKVILPTQFKPLSFVKNSLERIGCEVIFLERDYTYKLKKVLFPSHFSETGIFNDEVIRMTRRLLKANVNSNDAGDRFIYISRRKASKRKIHNEEELMPLLKKLNFKTVYCEEMSFSEQAACFATAKVLVTNHGAGLTNMMFMNEGGFVFELRYQNDSINNCYFALASALHLSYYYLQCKPVVATEDPHTADIQADLEEFSYILKSILAKACVEY